MEQSHDIPDIMINKNWIILNLQDAKIKHYIKIGDSIVKKSGSDAISVYRKNDNGKWVEKRFK